jgi:hypothetical protein
MHGQLLRGLLIGLFLAGCGSGRGGAQVDAPPLKTPDSATTETNPDAGCDEDAVGEDYFIKNCNPGGGGTPVARQNPIPYQTCKKL